MLDLEIGTVLHVKTFGSAFIVQKRADGFCSASLNIETN